MLLRRILISTVPGKQYQYILQGCIEQTASERQDSPCMYLAHHELKSLLILTLIVIIMCIITPICSAPVAVLHSQWSLSSAVLTVLYS